MVLLRQTRLLILYIYMSYQIFYRTKHANVQYFICSKLCLIKNFLLFNLTYNHFKNIERRKCIQIGKLAPLGWVFIYINLDTLSLVLKHDASMRCGREWIHVMDPIPSKDDIVWYPYMHHIKGFSDFLGSNLYRKLDDTNIILCYLFKSSYLYCWFLNRWKLTSMNLIERILMKLIFMD